MFIIVAENIVSIVFLYAKASHDRIKCSLLSIEIGMRTLSYDKHCNHPKTRNITSMG